MLIGKGSRPVFAWTVLVENNLIQSLADESRGMADRNGLALLELNSIKVAELILPRLHRIEVLRQNLIFAFLEKL